MSKKSKKGLKIFAAVVAVVAILGITANFTDSNILDIFKEKEQKDVYTLYAGKKANVEEGAIIIDGAIDDAYVCITPNGVEKVMINAECQKASGAIGLSSDQSYLENTSDITYYVAQTDSKIYIALKDYGSKWGASQTEHLIRNNYYFRIGATEDYSQAAVLCIPMLGTEANLMWFADAENTYREGYTDFVTSSAISKYSINDETGEEIFLFNQNNNSAADRYVAYIEIEIDKAMLIESFNSVFGTDIHEFESELFLASTFKPYYYTSNDLSTTGSFGYPWYGKVLTNEEVTEIDGKTKLMPYKIIFE